jgi:rSAM/selenodomain-associated transferase 1
MTGSGASIGIICKTPRAGASKTRLIPVLGPQLAADLSQAFLRDLAACATEVGARVGGRGYAVYAPAGSDEALRDMLPAGFGLHCMVGETFGHVLSDAARDLLDLGHDCVLLVNGDSPTLPADYLVEAVEALQRPGDRAVFGPALDGGYYVIGLKAHDPRLFADIAWSTDKVLSQSIERAGEAGLDVHLLPTWYDIDTAPELSWLMHEFEGRPPPGLSRVGDTAPATRALFARSPALRQCAVAHV